MTKIAVDALKLKLEVEVAGVEAGLNAVKALNSQIGIINGKSANMANAVQGENNADRQRAINLMNSYSSATERAAADVLYFNSALNAGTITADEHARALANVNLRMSSMAGGAGRMGYVVGNVMTGLEDFTTVLSITGFGMDGFAAATRSASNNLGQAVRGIGTASAAIIAPLVSIGAVLIGFAIPAIYRWVMGNEDAAESVKKHKEELDKLIRGAAYWNSIEMRDFGRHKTSMDIDAVTESKDMDKQITDALLKMTELDLKIANTKISMGTTAAQLFEEIINPNDDFNKMADAVGDQLGSNAEDKIRKEMDRIKKLFIDETDLIGGEAARQNLETNMQKLVETMKSISPDTAGQLTNFNDFQNMFFNFMNDAAVIDRIQAAQERVAELSNDTSEAARKEREELKSLTIALDEMLEKRQELIKVEAIWKEGLALGAEVNNKAELEADKAALELQHQKNKLIGDEFEAERKLLDLALRRREIMESGLAAPDALEGMFNDELVAMAADLEKQLAKMQDVVAQTDMQSQASAYTSANKQILEASKEQKTEEKEMVQLLTAIKNHLAGKNVLNVELIQ